MENHPQRCLVVFKKSPKNCRIARISACTGCPKKKVAIGPPKPHFLSENFEIFTVGTLFIADLVLFSDLKNFDFEGPKSMFEIFRNSQKTGC